VWIPRSEVEAGSVICERCQRREVTPAEIWERR
jgi:hypothetical protein